MRRISTVMLALALACVLASAAQAATITSKASTSVTFGPMKVKGYTLNGSATGGNFPGFSITLVRGGESHSYSFPKGSFSLHVSKSLSSGSLSAHLGKFGKLSLKIAGSGPVTLSKPQKGCTGGKSSFRKGKVTSSGGRLVLDHSFFHKVSVGHVGASLSSSGKTVCKLGKPKPGGAGGPNQTALSVTSGSLSASFARGKHRVTGFVDVLSSTKPLVSHSLEVSAPLSGLTNNGAQSATLKSFGKLLTGTGSYSASALFSGGSNGTLGGSLLAHFDSIGNRKVTGQAFMTVPGFKPPNSPPTASFSDFPTGNPNEVSFSDSSFDPDGSVVAWSWSFGDGQTSTLQNPTHAYATPGSYSVTETVTDNQGAKASATQTVTAGP